MHPIWVFPSVPSYASMWLTRHLFACVHKSYLERVPFSFASFFFPTMKCTNCTCTGLNCEVVAVHSNSRLDHLDTLVAFRGNLWQSFLHMMFSRLSSLSSWQWYWGSWTSRWDLGVLSEVGGWRCRNHSNSLSWGNNARGTTFGVIASSCQHFPAAIRNLFVHTVTTVDFLVLNHWTCSMIDCAFTLLVQS